MESNIPIEVNREHIRDIESRENKLRIDSKTETSLPVNNTQHNTLVYLSKFVKSDEIRFEFPYYFASFYNSMFYIFLVPFRVILSEKSQDVKICLNMLQRAMCVGGHCIAMGSALWDLRVALGPSLTQEPKAMFGISSSLTWIVFKIVFGKSVWSRMSQDIFKHCKICEKTWKASYIFMLYVFKGDLFTFLFLISRLDFCVSCLGFLVAHSALLLYSDMQPHWEMEKGIF